MISDKQRYAIILATLIFALLLATLRLQTTRRIPQCYEDAVLVGIGDFDNGRWDTYVCGPALDDCLATKQWQPYIP